MQPIWALVVQALLFGIWHVNANIGMARDDPLAALGAHVVAQAEAARGLVYGIAFLRMRNLVAPSASFCPSRCRASSTNSSIAETAPPSF